MLMIQIIGPEFYVQGCDIARAYITFEDTKQGSYIYT